MFVLFLSGCESGIPDEGQIEKVINGYYSALSKFNMSKAKSLYINGSDAFLETTKIEDFLNSLYEFLVP